MSYDRGAIKVEGLKGTLIAFPRLTPDRFYVTPGGIRAAGPARVLGGLTRPLKHETVKSEEQEN